MRRDLLKLCSLVGLIFTSGCVVDADSQPAHRSWPKPVAAQHVNQFEGAYRNRSLDYKTGNPTKSGTQLFEMLTSRTEPRGTRLEMQSSRTGDVLHLRLLDDTRRQVASAELRRDVDYSLSEGAMILRHKSLGWEDGPTNVGAVLRHSSFQLHLSATGGLLGRYKEGGVALMAYVLPIVGTADEWMFWPKLSSL